MMIQTSDHAVHCIQSMMLFWLGSQIQNQIHYSSSDDDDVGNGMGRVDDGNDDYGIDVVDEGSSEE